MKRTFGKIAAIMSAAVMAASLSGCADNGYLMTVDGMPIRNGVYISFQQTSMSNANSRLSQVDSAFTDNTGASMESNIFDRKIDGMSVSDWVKEDTKKNIKRFVAVQRLCEKFGITLTDDEITQINKEIQENWDATNVDYYGYNFTIEQIYGYKTMGDYYSSQGIGIDSLKEMETANKLSDKLFMYYYGEGGEKAVPSDELDKYFDENVVAYKLITMNYLDFRGDPVAGDEKQAIIDTAKSYADRYNNGEKFIDVLYDFDLLTAQNTARKDAEELYELEPVEGYTVEEYMEKMAGEASAEKGEADDDYDELIFIDSGLLTDELMEFIKSAPIDGKAAVYEGDTSVYVIIRNPVSNFPDWKERNLEDVLTELRGEEYDNLMSEMSSNYEIVQDDRLVNSKYAPEKLNK